MITKEELLNEINIGLSSGVISESDLSGLITPIPGLITPTPTVIQYEDEQTRATPHLNASEVLYYIGGLVLFGAQVALLSQSWDDLGSIGRVLLSLPVGFLVWALAVVLIKSQNQNKRRSEVGNALLLTGSLGVSIGIFITIYETLISNSYDISKWYITLGLGLIALSHWLLDRVVKKDVSVIFASLATAATFYAFFVSLMSGTGIDSPEFYGLTMVASAAIFAGIGNMLAKNETRKHLKLAMWSTSAFVVFATIYGLAASGDLQVLWQLLFPFMLYGAFAISAAKRIKTFLFTGGLFLFAFIMLISVKYFGDGAGLAAALLVGGVGVIASGIFLSNFNDKHFKNN